jgi:hypothetical protein
MGNLLTLGRRRRQMRFWPVAEGQGRDGRRVHQECKEDERNEAGVAHAAGRDVRRTPSEPRLQTYSDPRNCGLLR